MTAAMEEQRGGLLLLQLLLFDGSGVARVASSTSVVVYIESMLNLKGTAFCFVCSDGSSSSQINHGRNDHMRESYSSRGSGGKDFYFHFLPEDGMGGSKTSSGK